MADFEPSVGDSGSSRPRSGPGRLLRDQRLRRELSVGDVADGLHLDAATIDALERDDYSRLPPVTFVRGYLRAYGRLLEVPDEEILRRFEALGVEDSRRPLTASVGDARVRPAAAPPARRRGLAAMVTVSLALLVLVGGVGGGAWLLQQRDWSLPVLERLLGGEPTAEEDAGALPLAAAPPGDPSGAEGTADAGAPAGTEAAAPPADSDGPPAAGGPESQAGSAGRAGEAPAFDPDPVAAPPAAETAGTEAAGGAGTPPSGDGDVAAGRNDAGEPATGTAPTRSDAEIVAEAARRLALAPPSAEPDAATAPDLTAPPRGPEIAETPAGGGPPEAPVGEPAAQGAPAEPPGAAPDVAAETLRFRFTGESWMEVRDARGERLLFGLEDSGERVVEGVPPFEIVIGDTENVALEREGEPVALADYARDRVARFTLGSP